MIQEGDGVILCTKKMNSYDLMTNMESTQQIKNKDTIYGLEIYKWITWPLGIWPLDCENNFSIFRTSLALITQISFLISIVGEVCQNCSSIDMKIDLIGNLTCALMCFIKILMIRINRKKLLTIISSAIIDWSSNNDETSLKIMRSFAHKSRSFYIGQMSFALFTVIVMIITNLPLLLGDKEKFQNITTPLNPLPIPMDCFYKQMSKTTNIWIYSIQCFQLCCTALGNCGPDVFFFGLAMHICGQLKILENQMIYFGKIGDEIQLRRDLNLLIKRHNRLLNISQNLEDSFNWILMFQLFLNSLIIVILGIQIIISIKTGNTLLLPRVILAFMVLMAQLFIYCLAGNSLTEFNNITLLRAIYNCPWYRFPVNVIKDLVFIMMRTTIKFHITAGKFYNMDIENFKNIVKASMSYISVLLVMFKFDD